jgi:hypothetical protein
LLLQREAGLTDVEIIARVERKRCSATLGFWI